MRTQNMEELFQWTKALCAYAGVDDNFAASFWERIIRRDAILKEYQYFYEHENFLCEYKIEGVSVIDIMIWQIDHFKAELDRDSVMRTNKDNMVLMAFDTFLKMEENPTELLTKMKEQTGTDYPGKF